jgi:hypothetical protein
MKLRACRAPRPGFSGDHEDIQFLLHKMEIGTPVDAEGIHDRFFPNDALCVDARDLLKRVFSASAEK